MKLRFHSHFKFRIALAGGALLAFILCVQCIRTYLYTDAVLVPQQAQREAERLAMALGAAARNSGIADPRALGPVIERTLEAESDRVLWMRVIDGDRNVVAQAVHAPTTSLEWRESPVLLVDTSQGKAFLATMPLRMPRPHHGPGFALQLVIPIKAVTAAFDGLRRNLIVGVAASIALLIAIAVIALRTPQYLRGKYLEGELQLAKRVQRDLQPQPHSISADVAFAASSVAADHVGGDFYDIFEAAPGQTAIVMGDVSGKGVSAALLVSVLQGAIRSSTSSEQEWACERINRMLCELTARARFASLFWGLYDSASGTLRYVNAGHAAPMLVRRRENRIERLDEGGPVLGVLPAARYSGGSVRIDASDTLILYTDGVDEAANQNEEEFGEDRLRDLILQGADLAPAELCERIMTRVAAFATDGPPADDRTLMVVRFQPAGDSLSRSGLMPVEAFA
jgi:serine phosphatase RsbU (regulator of sigma subunit)